MSQDGVMFIAFVVGTVVGFIVAEVITFTNCAMWAMLTDKEKESKQ